MRRLNFVIDLETSGACPIRNGIVSICAIACDENLNPIDEFVMKVKPTFLNSFTWSAKAQEIHGFSYMEVMNNHINNDVFCYQFLLWLAKYKNENNASHNFICHASNTGWFNHKDKEQVWPWIDWNFLEHAFRKAFLENRSEMVWSLFKIFNPTYCLKSTIKMGREAGYGKNDLKSWAQRINFKLDHHDARSDAYACLAVYKYLISRGQNDSLGN